MQPSMGSTGVHVLAVGTVFQMFPICNPVHESISQGSETGMQGSHARTHMRVPIQARSLAVHDRVSGLPQPAVRWAPHLCQLLSPGRRRLHAYHRLQN